MRFGGAAAIDTEFEEIEADDGGVIVRIGSPDALKRLAMHEAGDEPEPDTFYDNLAEQMDDSQLAGLAEQLLEGIEHDISGRSDWMGNWERGISLLGLQLKTPSGEASTGGVSQVDHPLLLEACILSQSNACAELLPAGGPVKIDNGGKETAITDDAAMRLQEDMNEYLTVHRPEYYPDSEMMIFQRAFGGLGIKKIYHCPLRRAPVSDSVPLPDFIVSSTAKSIDNAPRATHRIKMDPATVKRMQYVGAWRDVDLQMPAENLNQAERKQASITGINPSTVRQEDVDYTIYECCCLIDMPGDEHQDDRGRVTGLPRPYIVTIEHDTRQVLEVRRNWVDGDDLFTPRRRYVAFPYLPTFTFYAQGLLHILGNSNSALTAAWRMMLDAGMFANFPGGMYLKGGERQQNTTFRAGPGQYVPVDGNGTDDIRKVIMPYPYKEPGPATQAFVEHIAETGARVGGTASVPVAEGKADAPVGTTLAALEQVSKMIAAEHRRAHQAQSLEFQTLLQLIREKPEDFVKYFEKEGFWTPESLTQALDQYTLIPRADPNTPTQMHRILKAMGLKQLEQLSPERYDGQKVDAHIMRTALGIDDPQEFFAPPAAPGQLPPDPTLAVAGIVAQTEQAKIASNERIKQLEGQLKLLLEQMKQRGTMAVTEVKEEGAMSRELVKIEGQQMQQAEQLNAEAERTQFEAENAAAQHQSDQEFQRAEGEASRSHAEKVAGEKNKTSLQAIKMRPKPAAPGKPK